LECKGTKEAAVYTDDGWIKAMDSNLFQFQFASPGGTIYSVNSR
jgi:hypothetical protein